VELRRDRRGPVGIAEIERHGKTAVEATFDMRKALGLDKLLCKRRDLDARLVDIAIDPIARRLALDPLLRIEPCMIGLRKTQRSAVAHVQEDSKLRPLSLTACLIDCYRRHRQAMLCR
jgi:hypothetical protein